MEVTTAINARGLNELMVNRLFQAKTTRIQCYTRLGEPDGGYWWLLQWQSRPNSTMHGGLGDKIGLVFGYGTR